MQFHAQAMQILQSPVSMAPHMQDVENLHENINVEVKLAQREAEANHLRQQLMARDRVEDQLRAQVLDLKERIQTRPSVRYSTRRKSAPLWIPKNIDGPVPPGPVLHDDGRPLPPPPLGFQGPAHSEIPETPQPQYSGVPVVMPGSRMYPAVHPLLLRQQGSRRYKIIDPRTGEEVLPRGRHKNLAKTASTGTGMTSTGTGMELDLRPVTGRLSVTTATQVTPRNGNETPDIMDSPRGSIGERMTPYSPGANDSLMLRMTPPRGRGRVSVASISDAPWACEKEIGTAWDWPLSRQEKKERVLLLNQLELLDEIEQLRAQVDADDCC